MKRINKSYDPTMYISNAKVGSVNASTLNPFCSKTILNDSNVSGSSSTINIEYFFCMSCAVSQGRNTNIFCGD